MPVSNKQRKKKEKNDSVSKEKIEVIKCDPLDVREGNYLRR